MPPKTNQMRAMKQWKVVRFTTEKEDLVRALPASWVLPEKPEQPNEEMKYSCYWPDFKYEFQLTNLVTKCAPPKTLWTRYEATICASASSYKAAKIKEELANSYSSSSEIDDAYRKILLEESDKSSRKNRHKKYPSGEDEEVEEEDGYEVEDEENVKSSSSDLSDEEDEKSQFPKTPASPDEITCSRINVSPHSITEPSAKRTKIENSGGANGDINFDGLFEDKSNTADNTAESNGVDIRHSSTSAKEEISKNLCTPESEVEDCQHHDLEYAEKYAVIKDAVSQETLIFPFKWMSQDLGSYYWPANMSVHNLARCVRDRVMPKISWQKYGVGEIHSFSDTYAEGLVMLQDERDKIKKAAKTSDIAGETNDAGIKPAIVDQVTVAAPKIRMSIPEYEQLTERDMLKVVNAQLENLQTNQNKILVALQHGNIQNVAEPRRDILDDIYRDTPCKTIADLERLEKKLETDAEYKKAFKLYMRSLSNKSGHNLMQAMISRAIVEPLQTSFTFEGKTGKVAFQSLFLWPILRDAACGKFINQYAENDAASTAKDWLKTSKRRVERAKNSKKRRTLQDLRVSGETETAKENS